MLLFLSSRHFTVYGRNFGNQGINWRQKIACRHFQFWYVNSCRWLTCASHANYVGETLYRNLEGFYITQCTCIHLYSSCFHQQVEYPDWLAVLHVTSDSLLLLIDHFLLVVAASPIFVYSDSQGKWIQHFFQLKRIATDLYTCIGIQEVHVHVTSKFIELLSTVHVFAVKIHVHVQPIYRGYSCW